MKRLNSLLGLLTAAAVTALGAHAQGAGSILGTIAEQHAPAGTTTQSASGETVTQNLPSAQQLTFSSEYKLNSEAINSPAPKRAPARKVSAASELAGTYVLSGTSISDIDYNGCSVTVEALGSDSIVLYDFWRPEYGTVTKAKVDGSTIIFPCQVVGQYGSYGDILLAKSNTSDGQPIMDEDITATIGEDGIISFNDPWTTYIQMSSSWTPSGIVSNATMELSNATFTGKVHSDGSTETYGIIFNQIGENAAAVKNLCNFGQTVYIILNSDKTASIPTSLIGYNSSYSDYYSYNLTFGTSGATIGSGDAVTDVATDSRTLSWTNWGAVTGNTSGTRYLVAGYDSCTINTTADITYPDPISVTEWEGDGTEASPYLIKVRDDLVLLSNKVADGSDFKNTYFKVVNDIDMSYYRFTPIAADFDHLFAGTFDGDGHTINSLEVRANSNFAALFGVTDTLAVIKNLNFDNATIVSSAGFVGTVVGYSIGKIENVSVNGSTISAESAGVGAVAGLAYDLNDITVTDCEVTGTYGYTGGIVGEVHSPMVNCTATGVTVTSTSVAYESPGVPVGGVAANLYQTSMENCYFAGTIDARSTSSEYHSVGGLAGWGNEATIKNSFAVGDIEAYGAGAIAGGLAGYFFGDIENSYFNGRVYDPESRNIGGAVGYLADYEVNYNTIQSTLTNVYATAAVSANTSNYLAQTNEQNNEIIGAIISGSYPVLTNIYFDKQLGNLTNSQYGVNTSELVSAQGPTGFDATVWSFSDTNYPALKTFENTAASKLSTTAVVLPEGASFDKFSKDATIYKDSEAVVSFYKNGSLSSTGYYATIADDKISLNTEYLFGNDTVYYTNPTIGVYYYRVAKIAPIPYDGSGTEDDPFLIKTKEDLVKLSQYTTVSKQLFHDTYFKVVNDIDLELDESFLGICTASDDSYNAFAGTIDGDNHTIQRMKLNSVAWSSQPETGLGTLNTDESGAYKGFIGRLDITGAVKNLSIASDSELQFYASSGAVVGYNSGLVENCRNYADVTGYSNYIGGLVGQNLKEGKILNCYNEGDVTGGYSEAGGIAGISYSLIEGCMNAGRVDIRQLSTNYASSLQAAGGIAGSSVSGGKYVNCVNAGSISSLTSRAGGIVGFWASVSESSTASYYNNDMNNVVSYGTVFTGNMSTIGAIAGGTSQSSSTDISGVYWDRQLLNISPDCNASHSGMNGVETSSLISGTALEGFDTDVWQFEAGKYPVLKQFASEPLAQQAVIVQLTIPTGVTTKNLTTDAVITAGTPTLAQGTTFTLDGNTLKGIPTTDVVVRDTLTVTSEGFVKIVPISATPVVPLEGSGTEEDPYRISNAQEWNTLADYISSTANDMTNIYLAVTADIDFSNETDGITPIGADGVTAFNGFLDGNNHTLSGYAFTTTGSGQAPLFGTLNADAVISNLTAAGTTTGGVSGSGGRYVGGVVAKLYGKLKNVTNTGTVTGIATYLGGIAAYAYPGAVLEEVVNTGNVSSNTSYVAGIAAYAYENTTFDRCVNKGDISTTRGSERADYVGGITAYTLPATFNQCVNDGNISGSASAGIAACCVGLEGGGVIYTFNQCVNNGDITGKALLGGITGYLYGSTAYEGIEDEVICKYLRCVNNGDITATSTTNISRVAGIAPIYAPGADFDHCINYGNITNNKNLHVAGIAGYFSTIATAEYPVTFQGCINYGKISSQAQMVAGVIDFVQNYTTIDSCYNYGDVEGLFGVAGICYTLVGTSTLTNCVNYGDVTVSQYGAGGIVSYNYNTRSVIDGCVNLGNISTTSTASSNNYAVGGIMARGYTNVTNCLNAGKITGRVHAGGIVGRTYNIDAAQTSIYNCVNIGEVVADEGCGGPIVGTEAGDEATYWGDSNICFNSYYLNDQSWRGTGASVGDYTAIGDSLSVAELAGLDLNGETGTSWFTADDYSFPVPVIGENIPDVLTHAAAVVLPDTCTYDNVTSYKFNVGNPAGTTWTPSSSIVVINGNDAQVSEVSQIEVTLTNTTTSDSQQAPGTKAYSGADGVDWILKLNVTDVSGINDNTLGKVVAQEAYYTVNGLLVEKPEASDGQIYIVVRKYTDGSMNAVKIRN